MRIFALFFFIGYLGLPNLAFAQRETKNFEVKDFMSVDVRIARS